MKIETQYAETLKAMTNLLIAFEACKHEDSEEGENISMRELCEIILPKQEELRMQVDNLYKELIIEQNKHTETLMGRCIVCERRNNHACELFRSMEVENWSDFRHYAERHRGCCVTYDDDKTTRECSEDLKRVNNELTR